jgi:hypothetical protein
LFGDGVCGSLLWRSTQYSFPICMGTALVILRFRRKFTPSLFGDGACDSLCLRSTTSQLVWGRCLRSSVLEEDSLKVCLGTVLAILCFWRKLTPSLFGVGACDSLFWKKIHFKFVMGWCDSSFLRSTPSKFVWGRCLRSFVFEEDSLQVCLGAVLAILCLGTRISLNLFGVGACDTVRLKKIQSKLVWGRCLRFFVCEEYSFPICLGTVLVILCFGIRFLPSLFGDGGCDSSF